GIEIEQLVGAVAGVGAAEVGVAEVPLGGVDAVGAAVINEAAGEGARAVANVERFEADAVEAASIQRARAGAGVDELALAAFAVPDAVSAVAEEFGSVDQGERGGEGALAGNENRSAPGGQRVNSRLDGGGIVGCGVAFGAVVAQV